MRLEFQAKEGGFYTPDDPMTFCLLFAVGGLGQDDLEHHITLQRGPEDEDPAEDWGVHFCFDDQSNGAYNCIQSCRLTHSAIEVILIRPSDPKRIVDSVFADISGFDEATLAGIRDGLPRIFRGTQGILEMECE